MLKGSRGFSAVECDDAKCDCDAIVDEAKCDWCDVIVDDAKCDWCDAIVDDAIVPAKIDPLPLWLLLLLW
jgi:hypothetical protein